MKKKILKALTSFFIFLLVLSFTKVQAEEEKLSFLIDAEVEEGLTFFLRPMFDLVGLKEHKIAVYVIDSPMINAAALPGGVVIVNKGLLLQVRSLEQLLGVLAHETGHIAGGHHARMEEALRNTQKPFLLGMLLSGVAIMAKSPDAALAALLGSSHVAERSYFAYRRGEESAADQAAVRILSYLKISPRGLMEFMSLIDQQSFLVSKRVDNYLTTHPLSSERREFFKHYLETNSVSQKEPPREWVEKWQRIQTKLKAFLEDPKDTIKVMQKAETKDQKYALSIAYFRQHEIEKALALLEDLVLQEPGNPFFYELKGQILFETGRISQSILYYQQAVALRPKIALLRIQLGHALIETNSLENADKAINHLKIATKFNHTSVFSWQLLATAYSKKQDWGRMAFCLAEKALLENDLSLAKIQATKAVKLLKQGPEWMRSQDILQTAKIHQKR